MCTVYVYIPSYTRAERRRRFEKSSKKYIGDVAFSRVGLLSRGFSRNRTKLSECRLEITGFAVLTPSPAVRSPRPETTRKSETGRPRRNSSAKFRCRSVSSFLSRRRRRELVKFDEVSLFVRPRHACRSYTLVTRFARAVFCKLRGSAAARFGVDSGGDVLENLLLTWAA